MGNLYIVATPIGNLQDISLRALDILKKADFIACEDTRVTGILIKRFFKGREKIMFDKLFSFYEQNEIKSIPKVINLLLNGKNVALVSDAGTPTISDPGFKLVRECLNNGIKVESLPGPSAVISALVSSGLPTDKFTFLGFLPQKPGHRKKLLDNLNISQKNLTTTVVFFESQHKILNSLKDLKSVYGNIEITVARELTKIHEEVKKETVDNFIELYKNHTPKGELVVLFNLK